MPHVNPTLPNDGESADAVDVAGPLLALLAVFNGHIGADNLEPGTIPGALGDSEITTAKLNDLAVTKEKIAAGAITPDKVAPVIALTPTNDATAVVTPLLNSRMNTVVMVKNSTFAPPSGTPADGQSLIIRIRDDNVQRSYTWNAIYRGIGVTLPTLTYNPGVYVSMLYNAPENKWDVVSVGRAG